MPLDMGDLALSVWLLGLGALGWAHKRNVGVKTWFFRIVPAGLLLIILMDRFIDLPGSFVLLIPPLLFASYAAGAYFGGWRLDRPKNRWLRGVWWMTHIIVYFVLFTLFVLVSSSIVYQFGRLYWTKGRIADGLPFAVEYSRKSSMCPEYDKRILFKSGKREDLLPDPCGFGPFRVYLLKDGTYCLEDGYDEYRKDRNHSRYQCVDVEKETVEILGMDDFFPGGKKFDSAVLEGKKLIGTIDTAGRFRKAAD